MEKNRIYIKSVKQISVQNPLQDSWMQDPVICTSAYSRALDPNFKDYIPPMQARRMGKLLARALITSTEALKEAGINNPDAIITGTGLGCIESTELFLNDLTFEGEHLLKPTYFMQSTHNTISSLVGINTKTHGYNVTYAHRSISFDSALYDALLQFRLGKIGSALVGSHDEMTPSYFNLLKKIGFVGTDSEIAGEAAVSVVLDTNPNNALCVLSGCKLMYRPSLKKMKAELYRLLDSENLSLKDIDAAMIGTSGNKENDNGYYSVVNELLGSTPLLHYKHIFGESYSASALGFYAAVCAVRDNCVPDILFEEKWRTTSLKPRNILLINHSDSKNYSFILLRSVCGE